ncbi:M1 family metallopeptidase [Candidatus Saccharibacteria bacterium]|nr:M1 family metallopeptidase [Candidatus Saccharibacteria bacterium]
MERLLKYFVPEKYVLDLLIDKNDKTIGGTVTVTGEVLAETVKFHAVGLKILGVTVNEKKAEFRADGKELEIRKQELGPAEIVIEYNGKLNENMQGAYLSTYEYEGKTETIVATQFESHYAREAFPCIDEPAAKAVFEVNITVPDKDDLVLVNAPSPRMSTYLLAWVVGRFHGKTVVNEHGVEITTYCALNQDIDSVDFANEIAARSLEFYDDNFGVSYPLKKLDQVALPDFEAGAMENWGLVTYRESMMLASKDATLATRKSVALTVAHELSHQWFGDLVTMEWWDDLWLNESFASVMEYYAVDAIRPEYKIFEAFFLGDAFAALMRDAYSGVQSVHQDVNDPEEIATLFDSAIVYAKGARLMLMVIRLMGWENFCKGISDYFKKHQYKNTVGDDLWDALKPYAEFDPKKLMHAFIDRPGYPVVTNQKGNFEKFSQQRFLLDGPCVDEEWPLPKITEDMSGHYILNLGDAEFAERLNDFGNLGLEEKLRLISDRDLITRAGLQSPASLIKLIYEFRTEDLAAVWNRVAGLIGNLRIYFDPGSEEEKQLKNFVLRVVDQKLDEIGLTTRKNDDENTIRMRANLLGLDYFAEDEGRLERLAALYDEDYTKMDVEIRADILSAKVFLEPEFASECIKKFQKIDDPDVKFDFLAAATLVRDDKELDKLMGLLGENEIVKPQDQLYLFVWLYRNPKCRVCAFEWLTKNWDIVRRIGGDKSLDSYPTLIARVARTEDEFKEYCGFFEPMLDDPSLRRAVQIGINEIKARLELIQKYQKAVYGAIKF